jgi:poly(hydroxyalkanoate) depolymerase family esterase
MRALGNIVSQFAAARRSMDEANFDSEGRLKALTGFGTNPGELEARIYVPTEAPGALVVVLHGCTQTAPYYDQGSGWSQLAERHGFALLYPQQRRGNNANLCFNWFQPGDARRGRGEASSISQMVKQLASQYRLPQSRIFITGLSAGGAMTSVMLACYPELFAGGAIIAGLPYACANTLPEALEQMKGQRLRTRQQLLARARAAADHRGDYPTLSVWHGTQDAVVNPRNATAIVNQWRDLNGIGDAEGTVELVAGHRRETWTDRQGRAVVERYDIRGMGHGTPVNTRHDHPCGSVGPHMLEASICSTTQIAESWGLVAGSATVQEPSRTPSNAGAAPAIARPAKPSSPHPNGVKEVIEDALRAAGLMR